MLSLKILVALARAKVMILWCCGRLQGWLLRGSDVLMCYYVIVSLFLSQRDM